MREADAVQRRLSDPADLCRRLDPERVERGRHHVDDVCVLRAHFASCGHAFRPVDDEWVADTAAVGLPLPTPEWGVASPGPAPRVVVEVLRPADLVDHLQALLERLLGVVEELRFVCSAGGAALCAGPVVGDHHQKRVLEQPVALEEVEQPTEMVIGVAEEAGEHLHHPAE